MCIYFPQYKRNHITSLYEACKIPNQFFFFFLIESGLFTNRAIREALNIDRCLEIKIVQVRCLPKRKKKNHIIQFIVSNPWRLSQIYIYIYNRNTRLRIALI